VIIKSARIRVQDRNGAGRALQLLVVLAESTHRIPTTLHQRRVNDALVRAGERPEFRGKDKSQQKILGRQRLLQLTFQPLLALMVLAVWAVAMAARVRHQLLMVTARTFDLHRGAGVGAAGCQYYLAQGRVSAATHVSD